MLAWLEIAFTGIASAVCAAAAFVVLRQWFPRLRNLDMLAGPVVFGLPAVVAWDSPIIWAALVTAAVVTGALRRARPYLHVPGAALIVLMAFAAIDTGLWLPAFAMHPRTDSVTAAVVLIFAAGFAFITPAMLTAQFLALEPLLRDSWSRSRPHAESEPARRGPMVSVHVPCYAEPPEIVIATLDSLANLDYDNFEVLVIDNNTEDPALWEPVRRHCRTLGDRFRFFHVTGMTGAKAGALNYALTKTDPAAELIALVDADWQVRPDFLSRLAPYFTDPRMAAVQTRYDYRDWRERRFLTGCFWHYRVGFPTLFRSLDERRAAFTVGTMCVLRRRAVEQVGGWATWCLTEDSEIVVRLQAVGYESRLVLGDFGHGLIPERFADYTKQRYRWTFGPVQEFRRHWRLILARSSKFSPAQRFLHLHHGFGLIAGAIAMVLSLPVTAVAVISLAWHEHELPLGSAVLLVAVLGIVVGPMLRLTCYRVADGLSARQGVAVQLMTMSLQFTCARAALTAARTGAAEWARTSKFTVRPVGVRAIWTARGELLIAAAGITVAVACAAAHHTGAMLLLELALAVRAACLLAAPVAVLLADRELRPADSPGFAPIVDSHPTDVMSRAR
ncbi:glycosyltransferase family 2 protein [Nocardia sp. XZ_19_385]|uniref:glycosyltransferase family 2 protein n=1 Tax=Nocardia sp. XZ_19_385 TaxID=2769488 RepID=UPI00188EAF84|nr:glycosyltransferase family 2 protein [Nocardia sp. XZ_19_385]